MDLTANLPPQLVDIVIDLTKKIISEYGPVVAKKLWEQAQQVKIQKPSFAIKGNLVDREPVIRAIKAALNARGNTRVIYLCGSGGAGKTRLLEESKIIASSKSSLYWAGIFDLYHTDLHNPFRLQSAIIESLNPGRQYFTDYWEKRELFERKRGDGVFTSSSDAAVQSEIATLNQLFIDALNQFTSRHRVVLAFDTLENVGEELDLIQQVFKLETVKGSLSARQWLLDLCREARNTVILLAGRPNVELKSDLERINTIDIGRVESISVEGLTQSDTSDLLTVYTRNAPRPIAKLLSQNAINIWQATKGLPVHVALTVELILQTPDFLSTRQNNDPELERKVVRAFFDSEKPDRRHLFFLALARKGLTPDLLNYLERRWSKEECVKRLTDVENLTLIKKRHGENELFLHDALYEMFDEFAPYSQEEKIYWNQRLREYYQNSNKEEQLHWEKSIVNILYYDLRCDCLQAFYRNFTRWSEIAIKGYEIELDSQLRNEIFIYLRSNHRNDINSDAMNAVFNQDNAIRWVKRLNRRSQYKQAIEVAEILFAFDTNKRFLNYHLPVIDLSENDKNVLEPIISTAPPIFWASLLTYYGEALTYLTKQSESQIETVLTKAIDELNDLSFDRQHDWLRDRLLGYTHDRLGYLARVNGHYKNASEYYHQALQFYKDAEILDEYAFTQNNLAFVLALLGDVVGAKAAAEDALTKRLELGQRYPIALSYNTRGLIRALENSGSLDGQRDCELALSIFEEINTPRGIGLACNALGFILRKRGEGWTLGQCTPEQAKQWYTKAEEYFERAKEIFKDGEKIRLWEALNELGCLNRDWACLLKFLQDEEGSRIKFKQAKGFQEQALVLAQESNMRFQQVDTLDDVVELSLDLGDFEQARQKLEECRALIPPEFNLTAARNESYRGEIYWFSLAKIQMREGMMRIWTARQNTPRDILQVADGIQCLLNSFMYFSLYSEQQVFLEKRAQEIAATLKTLEIPGELVGDTFRQIIEEHGFNLSILRLALSKEYNYEKFS
ncbi:MAG: ATP-binding protein [Anaerolineales bacterium]|nr:ATP-binding protein [Anaerolineales bacterium]MCZ2288886.1 ATP-binding protein [Anaerolineales bacterium]